MNILFICENYLPHTGGAEILFKNLAERYTQSSHHTTILTHQLKNTQKTETLNRVNIHRIPSLFSRYIFTFASIPKAISLAKNHDIIQTTTFNGAFPAWLAAKITKKPVVLTVHEVWIGKWSKITGFGKLKSSIHNLLERCIYFLPYDHYICVSDATKSDLLKHKPHLATTHSNKVTTIYNGLDYEFWNPKSVAEKDIQQLKESHKLQDKYILLAYGRPGQSKGFEYLIQSFPNIKQQIPNAHLLLIFGSPEKYQKKYQELLNLIDSQHIKEHTTILTNTPYSQIRNYIKSAHSVIIPSTAEGFGYTAVESAAMDVPVIVSSAGSLPEVISGKYQIFESQNSSDLAEKVIMVSKNKHWQKPLKRFEWDDSVGKYLGIYESLLKNKSK